jgi:rhodanese-related sulfurtransferase
MESFMLTAMLTGFSAAAALAGFSVVYSHINKEKFHTKGAVSFEKFEQMLRDKEDIDIIDLCEPEYYRMHRIKGAINIPADNFRKNAADILHGKKTVLYCKTGKECRLAFQYLEGIGHNTENLYYLDAEMVYTAKYTKQPSEGGLSQ